jgi:hypothetical protein
VVRKSSRNTCVNLSATVVRIVVVVVVIAPYSFIVEDFKPKYFFSMVHAADLMTVDIEQVVIAVKVWTYFREMLGSNLGRDTGYNDWLFHVFPQSLQKYPRYYLN